MAEKPLKHNCGICLNDFTNPKIIDCFHTFCEICLESYVANLKTNPFPCPMCRAPVKLPASGVSGFSANFYMSDSVTCDSDEDISAGLRFKSSCQQHKKDADLYCEDCLVAICSKCLLRNHKEHKVGHIEDVAKEKRNVLRKLKTNLEEVLMKLYTDCADLKLEKARIQTNLQKQCERVDQNVKNICEDVRSTGDEMKTKMEKFCTEQDDGMTFLELEVDKLTSIIQEFKEQTTTALNTVNISDTITLSPKINKFMDDHSVKLFTVPNARLIHAQNVSIDRNLIQKLLGELQSDAIQEPIKFETLVKCKLNELEKGNCTSYLVCRNGVKWKLAVTKSWNPFRHIHSAFNHPSLNVQLQFITADSYRCRFNLKLMNAEDDKSIEIQDFHTFSNTGIFYPTYRWKNVISWETVSDPRNGFIFKSNVILIAVTFLNIFKICARPSQRTRSFTVTHNIPEEHVS